MSDYRRNKIQAILESFDHEGNRTHTKVEAALVEVEALAGKEGLAAQMGDFYSIIAEIYLSMGDTRRAKENGERAVKILRQYAGFDNDRTEIAVEFLRRLERRKSSPEA